MKAGAKAAVVAGIAAAVPTVCLKSFIIFRTSFSPLPSVVVSN